MEAALLQAQMGGQGGMQEKDRRIMELLHQRGFAVAAPQAHHPPAERFYDRTLYQPSYQAPAQVCRLRAVPWMLAPDLATYYILHTTHVAMVNLNARSAWHVVCICGASEPITCVIAALHSLHR